MEVTHSKQHSKYNYGLDWQAKKLADTSSKALIGFFVTVWPTDTWVYLVPYQEK